MKSTKVRDGKTLDQIVLELTGAPLNALYSFEVVPLDYNVNIRSTPHLFLSKTHLVFTYDDIIEIYDLREIELTTYGEAPRFNVANLFLEGNFTYEDGNEKDLFEMKQSEALYRLSITESQNVPKEFVLRQGSEVQKGYKTWAMYKIISNMKYRLDIPRELSEMLAGSFTQFNQKTVLSFIVIFLVYLVSRFLLVNFVSDIFGIILDIAFGFVLVFMLIWVTLSQNKNFKRYQSLYFEDVNSRFNTQQENNSVSYDTKTEISDTITSANNGKSDLQNDVTQEN